MSDADDSYSDDSDSDGSGSVIELTHHNEDRIPTTFNVTLTKGSTPLNSPQLVPPTSRQTQIRDSYIPNTNSIIDHHRIPDTDQQTQNTNNSECSGTVSSTPQTVQETCMFNKKGHLQNTQGQVQKVENDTLPNQPRVSEQIV